MRWHVFARTPRRMRLRTLRFAAERPRSLGLQEVKYRCLVRWGC